MLRRGLISEIYPDKGLCRVKFLDDGIVSPPLQILFLGTQDNKFYVPFAINELVACMMAENGDDGVVLGCIYSDEDKPSGATANSVRIVFKDDTVIDYDFAAHKLTADVKGDIDVKCVNLQVEASGSVIATVEGSVGITCESASISATDGSTITGNVAIDGELSVTGKISSDTEVEALTVQLTTHVHSGVQTGGGSSGPPVP